MKTDTSAAYVAVITCLFSGMEDAESACTELIKRGYTPEEITVIMSDETRGKHFDYQNQEIDPATTTINDAGMEVTLSTMVGIVAALGSVVAVPGIGLIVGGPLSTVFSHPDRTTESTGITEALLEAGIPEEHTQYYEKGLLNGGIVIGVAPRNPDDRKAIVDEWNYYQARQIHGSEAYTV